IVSEASRSYREYRNAVTVNGGYKPQLYGVSASGSFSQEPDYVSMGGHVSVSGDFNHKLITPTLGYAYSHDLIGRNFTPFSVFEHTLDTQTVEASAALVLSPSSVLLVSGTVDFERGDQSKPYRYVPMFAPAIAGLVTAGEPIENVNIYRLPVRP